MALRYYDMRDIRLEQIPKPEVKDGEVLIKVTDAGMSQTQINEFVEGPFIINRTTHALTGKKIPLIPCQEYGGIIEKVGGKVSETLVGEQVAVLPLVSCGKCRYCLDGRENLCDMLAYHGLIGLDGGFCEYSTVSAHNIIPVADRSMLTFIEPILVAIHAANRYETHDSLKNKKVLILGAGAIGISMAAVWRDCYGAEITLNDILPYRMKLAEKAGLNIVQKAMIGHGYDIVVDAAGMDTLVDKPAIIEGTEYLKKGGILLNLGTYFHPVSFVPSSMLISEQVLCESLMYSSSDSKMLPDILKTIKMDFSVFIEEAPLKDIIEKGYYRAEVDKDGFTRIVIRPN